MAPWMVFAVHNLACRTQRHCYQEIDIEFGVSARVPCNTEFWSAQKIKRDSLIAHSLLLFHLSSFFLFLFFFRSIPPFSSTYTSSSSSSASLSVPFPSALFSTPISAHISGGNLPHRKKETFHVGNGRSSAATIDVYVLLPVRHLALDFRPRSLRQVLWQAL